MDLGLCKRKFLITGGSSGLGLAAARSLVAEGADVAICGRSQERLDQAVSSLETPGQDVVGFQADVTDPEAFGKLREGISERWDGVLDGLVITPGSTPRASLKTPRTLNGMTISI